MSRSMGRVIFAAALVHATGVAALAQETTSATATKTFEVIAVNGNQLVVSLPEGTREMSVPDDFRFVINGQPMSVHELKAGMKGTATITTRTTTTPVTITEVKNGTLVKKLGQSLLVRTEDDEVKSFVQADLEKRNLSIMRDGKPARVSDFREGDKLTVTFITTKPPQTLTEREVQATLAEAAPPSPVAAPPPPVAAPPQPQTTLAARELPRTASSWPLRGLASVLLLGLGLSLSARRRLAH
jgi:hypothetical protein